MTLLSLTPIAVFINITTAESWYCQDWETRRRKVNTTHFLASTLFTLVASKLWVWEWRACLNEKNLDSLIDVTKSQCWLFQTPEKAEGGGLTSPSGAGRVRSRRSSSATSSRSGQSSSLVQVLSSQLNKFKQTALLSASPAVPLTLLWGVTRLHSPWSQYNTKCW